MLKPAHALGAKIYESILPARENFLTSLPALPSLPAPLSHFAKVDSRLILTASWDRTAKIWEVASGTCLRTGKCLWAQLRRRAGWEK